MKGHENGSGLGASDMWGEAERWGFAASGRDSSGDLSSVCQYLVGEVKKMEDGVRLFL